MKDEDRDIWEEKARDRGMGREMERHGEILRDRKEDRKGGASRDKRWGIKDGSYGKLVRDRSRKSASGGGAPEGKGLKTQKAGWGLPKAYHGVQGYSQRPGAPRHL